MGRILDKFRRDIQEQSTVDFLGRRHYTDVDSSLYLSARMHDAENEKREMEALAHATETAALRIIGKYDPKAARDFYAEVQALKNRYMQ